jgi:hypothetical protein
MINLCIGRAKTSSCHPVSSLLFCRFLPWLFTTSRVLPFAAEYARKARREVPAEMAEKLRYYNHAMHKAAFALPASFEKQLSAVRAPARVCHSVVDYALYGAAVVAAAAAGAGVAAWLVSKRK